MKKSILLVFGTMTLSLGFAQLKSTKWQGAIKGDNPRSALLDFKRDTLVLYSGTGTEKIETMIYEIKGQVLTLRKIDGQSDCDNATPGIYQFVIKGDKIVFKLGNDPCYDRSSALDATEWTRVKTHP